MTRSMAWARREALLGETIHDRWAEWSAQIRGSGACVGWDSGRMEPECVEALVWCGVPCCSPGTTTARVRFEPERTAPHHEGEVLRVPSATRLRSSHAVALAPVREWIAQQWGFRLKAPPGVLIVAWADRLVLLNARSDVAMGFCYGPTPGHRCFISIPSDGWQVVRP